MLGRDTHRNARSKRKSDDLSQRSVLFRLSRLVAISFELDVCYAQFASPVNRNDSCIGPAPSLYSMSNSGALKNGQVSSLRSMHEMLRT
jgi:hypothetical protein